VVGGVTRSELRVAHALAARTGRDITLGSTSIETPASFLQRVQVRSELRQVRGAPLPSPALPPAFVTGQLCRLEDGIVYLAAWPSSDM